MLTDHSLRALREANPRQQPGFEESLARYDALRARITSTPAGEPRGARAARPRKLLPSGRPRLAGLSAVAAAVALAAVLSGLLATASPQSAYAAAKQALAATSAAALRSGTMALAVTHGSTRWTLYTVRWHGHDIALSSGQGNPLGGNRQLVLAGGGAYLQRADGRWVHYPAESDVGPKLGPDVKLARDEVAGNTASAILALATHLHKTVRPDGTAVYTGTIPADPADTAIAPRDDSIMRVITRLRSVGDTSRLQLVVGRDGLVRQMSETIQSTGSKLTEPGQRPTGTGSWTWAISYSQLGSTPAIPVSG
jgi:uncharacterized protein YjeT (DUF2065 family)